MGHLVKVNLLAESCGEEFQQWPRSSFIS
jgi:hypothetical protein